MKTEAQEIVDKRSRSLKRDYQINYAQALSKMKHRLVSSIIINSDEIIGLIKQTCEYIRKQQKLSEKEKVIRGT